jgi:hypothetical protein
MSDTNAQLSEPSPGGASPAAKEFQQSQAAGTTDTAASAVPDANAGPTSPTGEAPAPLRVAPRLAERKMVSGKAQIALGSGFSVGGKLIDLSEGGVCVMLDDPVTIKKVCNISCNIFQNGKGYNFSLPSVVAYCVLVSGRGYKVGFQFGPRSPAVTQTIADVLKAS